MAVKLPYMCLTLLLLVGTQLATSKSVDEKFKDNHYIKTLSISKRDANEESKGEEATTESDDEVKEVTPLQVTTTEGASKTRRQSDDTTMALESTTVLAEDDEAATTLAPRTEQEETATVNPLGEGEREDKDKAGKAQAKPEESDDANRPKKPTTLPYLPPLEDRLNSNEPAPNLLPPMPYEYLLLPQIYNEFIPPQAFAPWLIYAQPQPEYPSPYDYPHPSGPAFSEPSGASAYAGGFASASASASGSAGGGVQQSSSSFGGPLPSPGVTAQQSASSFSGPAPGGGVLQSSSSHSGPGVGAQQSASAFSGPAPGAGVYQSSSSHSGPLPKPGPGVQISTGPSFVSMRGSFSPDGDDESVAIEVDGPARSGSPVYAQGNQGVGISGPGYSASAGYGPGPYGNSIPSYGPTPYGNAVPSFVGPQDFQAFIQQYFAALQAQQLEFQRQLQAQIQAQQQAIWDQSNRVDSNFGAGGGAPGAQSASASANYGPGGGYQSGQISPASPGIFSRFGESIPPPAGNSYGVFSSSSSSSFTGPDGKQVNRKVASVGVNDNGKVSVKTVHDP